MSYLDWHVGMKVVCVDNGRPEVNLVVGRIYTLSAIVADGFLGRIYVQLAETPDASGWYPRRFRPVQPRKTDISIFKAMLNKRKAREPV